MIRITATTDNQHLGIVIPLPCPGDRLMFDDVSFLVVMVTPLVSNCWRIFSYNYVIDGREV